MATLHLKKSIKLKSLSSTRDRNVKSDSQYKNALHYKKQTLSFADRINQWKEEWISPFYNNINIEKYYNAKDIQIIKNKFAPVYINKNYPNVFIYFMTVHGAKGLEAENVIILNMEDDILGFPNKVINDYLLSPLLIQTDTYPLAEERRIFYVALTRGKEQCFLCVPSEKNKQSFFYKEIRDKVKLLGKTSEIMMREQEGETCPRCKSGQLIRKYNKTTKEAFLACSNYNQGEGCHYTREYNTIKH